MFEASPTLHSDNLCTFSLSLSRNAINRQASLVLLQFWSFLSELDSSFHPIFLLRCGSDSALYELSLLDSSRFFLAVTIPRHG